MIIYANAKINLSLDVAGVLENGYHSVSMIMQEISLCDTVSLTFGGEGIALTCDNGKIPLGNGNIAYRAAEAFYNEIKKQPEILIDIKKKIPSAAGMAGGSADAAAVLKGLYEHYEKPFKIERLYEIGKSLGADVPFCIMGGTALAEGIGEVLTPLKRNFSAYLVIVKPDIDISTPWAYKMIDENDYAHADVCTMKNAVENGNIYDVAHCLANSFEDVIIPEYKEIADIKDALLHLGAVGAMMSGSGPSVFGLFESKADAIKAYGNMKEKYNEVFIAEPM